MNGLSDMGYPMSLHNLDSIAAELLIQNGLGNQYYIYIINLRTGEKLNGIGTQKEPSFMAIKPKYFPIRSDYTQVVQLIITNPNKTFLERMGLLIIATIIIMVFVIGCITYQIKIITALIRFPKYGKIFSYAMVHDMKTPLTTIFTALSFLHSGRLDDKPETKEKFFNVAKEEADRLLTLTNKLLTISKLENKKMKMECEKIALEPMLVRLADKFKVKSHKPVSFEFDLQTPEIYADAEYIEEVFSNLIDNSIKYSKERVDIRISSSKKRPLFHYQDIRQRFWHIGKGPAQHLQQIRACSGWKQEPQEESIRFRAGVLNFVQQVIEAHKGKIFVNSIEGEFTEFIIYLPLMVKEL